MRLFTWLCLFVSAVYAGAVIDWSDSDIAAFESRPVGDRFYLFYADWCGACRRFKPEFESAVKNVLDKYPKLEVIRVNLDKAPLLSKTFKISHLPTLFYETKGTIRNVNRFRGNLMKLLGEKQWQQVEPTRIGASAPGTEGASKGIKAHKFKLTEWIESQGVSAPSFFLAVALLVLMVLLFIIWLVWLYTDYKLNGHRLTEEAIQERLRLLRKLENEQYGKDRDSSSDDSGNESDDDEDENAPLSNRRTNLRSRMQDPKQ